MTYLDDYTVTENSDNRHRYVKVDEEDILTIGGNYTYVFALPFKYSDVISSGEIFFKQGLHNVFEDPIQITEDMVVDKEIHKRTISFITVQLQPIDTQRFEANALDTFSQLKLKDQNDYVFFEQKHPIKVIMPLDDRPIVG